jgi:hypothetical protein
MLSMKNSRNNRSATPAWWLSRDSGAFRPKPPPVYEEDDDLYEEDIFTQQQPDQEDIFKRRQFTQNNQSWEEEEETPKSFASRFSYSDNVPPPTKEILYDLLRTLDVKDEEIGRLSSALSEQERLVSRLYKVKEDLDVEVHHLKGIVKSLSDEPIPPPSRHRFDREEQEVTGRERDIWKRDEKRYRDKILQYENQINHLQDRIREHVRREQLAKPTSNTSQTNSSIESTLFVSRDAPQEVVEAAYRSLTKLYHPDKKGGSEDKMKALNIAKEAVFNERGWTKE